MIIRRLHIDEQAPLQLMLLADPSEAMIEAYGSDARTWVLEQDGVIIGVYVLKPLQDGGIELMNLAIDEQHQGKGFGQSLLKHALREASASDASYLVVGTGNSSVGQLYLYQKVGFRMNHIDQDYFTKHYAEPLVEDGIPCRDRVVLKMELKAEQ